MGWKDELVEKSRESGESISVLCRELGISRAAGHKWLKRFKEEGYLGLEERSRRPRSSPTRTGDDVVAAVLDARDSFPAWGPKRLVLHLAPILREATPSARTIARILRRENRVRDRFAA